MFKPDLFAQIKPIMSRFGVADLYKYHKSNEPNSYLFELGSKP